MTFTVSNIQPQGTRDLFTKLQHPSCKVSCWAGGWLSVLRIGELSKSCCPSHPIAEQGAAHLQCW